MRPQRIQRKRTKGWRMPEGAVYVGRPTKWRNPFAVGDGAVYRIGALTTMVRDNRVAVLLYKLGLECGEYEFRYGENTYHLHPMPLTMPDAVELRGKDLACWCPLDAPCHADVLLELANKEDR